MQKLFCLICGMLAIFAGCNKRTDDSQARHDDAPCTIDSTAEDDAILSPTVDETAKPAAQPESDPYDIPRFASNSPFDTDYESPVPQEEKRLWAGSFIWEQAPELIVEKWLTDTPDTTGKYVLIEFWATWCPPCRRSLTLLNTFHAKYKDELVVIGISDETEDDVRKLKDPPVTFYSAIDTQARTKKQLGVFGIPHVILLEPNGYVVWEGFPLLKGHELTDEIIENILSVGRMLKAQQPDDE